MISASVYLFFYILSKKSHTLLSTAFLAIQQSAFCKASCILNRVCCFCRSYSLITADFSAAAVLITFGAVLGKVSRLQLLVIAFIEIIMFTVNEFILLQELDVADAGGSMVIHCFGAYFGLGLAFVLQRPADTDNNPKEGSVYHSDLFAMIGRFKILKK